VCFIKNKNTLCCEFSRIIIQIILKIISAYNSHDFILQAFFGRFEEHAGYPSHIATILGPHELSPLATGYYRVCFTEKRYISLATNGWRKIDLLSGSRNCH
jgi:hypothetical protein